MSVEGVNTEETAVQLQFGDHEGPRPALASDDSPLPPRGPDRVEIVGSKTSIFYRAHSYHTKVPPEGIARVIEHFTDAGDFVLDPFCGSGMTGVACLMTGRQGLLSDLSPAAVHIATNYVTPLDPRTFERAATVILNQLSSLEQDLYGTACPTCAGPGRIEYTVWSDIFVCPSCDTDIEFWSDGLDDQGTVAKSLTCPSCNRMWVKRQLRWKQTIPVIQSVSCSQCHHRAQRTLSPSEQADILGLDRTAIPYWFPIATFESSREMWRGQHREQGIATAADFFTTRNLWCLAAVWDRVNQTSDARVGSALRFLFTSVINRASRRYQWNQKRPTNVLTSTMYIASLSYEFNVFSLLRRKVKALTALYRATAVMRGSAEVALQPAQAIATVPDASVHYVFTDPPFGSNIFYSDSSFLWEAWIGSTTDTTKEAVVNKSVRPEDGGKTLTDYEKLMTGAFEEVARVLRPNGWASVMFHNSDDQVWSTLERAIETAGFEVGSAVAFDKKQASFKGIKGLTAGERVPSFDLVLHLTRSSRRKLATPASEKSVVQQIAERMQYHVAVAAQGRRTTPYLHSFVMRTLLEEGWPLTGFTYGAVEVLCGELFEWDGAGWRLPAPSSHDNDASTSASGALT